MSRGFVPRHAWDAVLEVRKGSRVHLRRVSPSARRYKLPQHESWSMKYDMARLTLMLLETEGGLVAQFNSQHWNCLKRSLGLDWKVSFVPEAWHTRNQRISRRKQLETVYYNQTLRSTIPALWGKMHDYQKTGVSFALALMDMGETHGCLIADEMGLGKTLQGLAVCKHLFQTKKDRVRCCVVCPGYLRANWDSEITKWGVLDSFDQHRPQTMIKLLDRPSQNEGSSPIVLVSYRWMRENYECLSDFDLVIFDECHLLKNGHHTRDRDCSLRYLAARELVKKVKFCLMLTGTPAPNCPKEMYAILHLCGALPQMKWAEYAFRYSKRYFSTMFFGWDDDGTSAEEELKQLQEFSCIRRLAKDWLVGLPDEMRSFVTLPLHKKGKLQKLAKERNALLEKLQNGALTDAERSKYSKMLRFNRTKALVASAEAKNKSFKQYFQQYLKDHPFERGAQPFIVFAYHEKTIDTLVTMFEELGVSIDAVYGGTSKLLVPDIIGKFQRGQLNVLILSLAMCAGLNLQRASTAFFAEVTWSPGVLAQAEKRIHRQGSEHARVHYVYLFGEPPAICADVYRKCQNKCMKLNKTLRDVKRRKIN